MRTISRTLSLPQLQLAPPFYYWLRKNNQGEYMLALINSDKIPAKLKINVPLPSRVPLVIEESFAPLEVKTRILK